MPTQASERVRYCPTCHRMLGISCACGMPLREKLLGLQINRENFETGEKRNYYDSEAVDEIFGADSRERLMEESKGVGYVRTGPDGSLWKRNDAEQRIERLTQAEEDHLFGADTERDGDA